VPGIPPAGHRALSRADYQVMTAARERETALLAALGQYGAWHTVGFLAGRELLPLDWPEAGVRACAEGLEVQGLVASRKSAAKGQVMYHITENGQRALATAGRGGAR
jgi:hypothetical protein